MPTQWDEFEAVDEQPSIDWSEFEPVSAQGETREQLTAQMEQAREERKQSEMADKIGELAERTLEPLTFPGLLNQPARIAGQPDPFHAGESIAPIPMPTGTGVISGLGQLGAGVVNSLTTPEGLATLPLAAVSAPIRALFAAEMASALPEQIAAGGEALRSPETTPAQKVVAAGQPLVTAAFVRGLAQTPKLVKDIADLRKAEVKPEFKPEEFEPAPSTEPSILAPEKVETKPISEPPILAPEKTDVPIEVPGVEAVRAGPGAAAPADVA